MVTLRKDSPGDRGKCVDYQSLANYFIAKGNVN